MKAAPLTPADDGRVAPSIGTFEGTLAEYLAERSNIPVYILEEGVKITLAQPTDSEATTRLAGLRILRETEARLRRQKRDDDADTLLRMITDLEAR